MLKTWTGILAFVALLAACTPLAPRNTEAVQIQGTPGKAVVYLVRSDPDLSYLTAPVVVNDQMIGSTHAGTYFRLELPAGRHVIRGYASDNGTIALDLQADRVYFVEQKVAGSYRVTNPESFFSVIDERRARSVLAGAQRMG